MNSFTESIWDDVRGHTWKYALRGTPIIGALVHATRSTIPNNPTQREYDACKNWYRSPNNKTIDSAGNVAGAFTHAIIGGGGKLCICLPDEYYPRWSAGHMDTGGLWSVEIAEGTADTLYDPLDIERAEHEIAKKAKQHGFPAKYIPYMSGDNREAPGIAFHDASRNGTILGKSDPGEMPPFNDRAQFVARIGMRMMGLSVGSGGGDVFVIHNRAAKFGNTPNGWAGKDFGPGKYSMQLRPDVDLPPSAKMARLDIRIGPSSGAELVIRNGDGSFAGVMNADRKVADIEVVPDANGAVPFEVTKGAIVFVALGSIGYWTW